MDETRYRTAERRLWDSVQLEPDEERVRLACTGTDVRVQSVGEGPPVVFVHGSPNAGSTWVPLMPFMAGFRCHLVDRPGTGLSDDHVIEGDVLGTADRFVGDVLDGLGLERAHVVASSLGGFLALRSAAAEPARVERMVQMGCPAMAPGMRLPKFMRPMRHSFVRWLIPRLPPSPRNNTKILRELGHGAAIDAGRLTPEFDDWYLALQGCTNTMRNDLRMTGGVLEGRGFDESLTLDARVLGRVRAPTLFLWGEADGFGGADVARATVGSVPGARLELLADSGHLPWLDDPARVGAAAAGFLEARDGVPTTS